MMNKEYLLQIRKNIILNLTKKEEIEKILTFLNKCGIYDINEKDRKFILGVPNEFIANGVKKFFLSKLNECLKNNFNEHFSFEIKVIPEFSNGNHPLQLNIKNLLNIKNEKKLSKEMKDTITNIFGILIDKSKTFSNFIVGSSNQMAYEASFATASNPGKIYNPLFIRGNVGLGKTHLLHAIGNHIIKNFDYVIAYFSSTKLIDEIVNGIKSNKLNQLIEKFKKIDVLIIDDVQFLAGKEKTQEIFYNLFNELYIEGKQIVLSSDQPPKLLSIEKRLTSRFSMGLVVDIQKPDFETRLAILKSKAPKDIPESILNLIAEHIQDNIRELEGTLNIIVAKYNLNGNIDENEVLKILKNLGYKKEEKSIKDLKYYLEKVAKYYGINENEIIGVSRKKEISIARQLLMYIGKKHLNRTYEKIGLFFGKNHASVIYAVENFEKLLKTDKNIKKDLENIIEF